MENLILVNVLDHEGDKICIFGFSRGAYTARALAGMIHKVCARSIMSGSNVIDRSQVGLLPAGNHQQVPFAYKMYSRDDETGWTRSTAFKKAFSIDVEIEFVGVWYVSSSQRDTYTRHLMRSVGIRFPQLG